MSALKHGQRHAIDVNRPALSSGARAAGAGRIRHASSVLKALTLRQPWAWAVCHAGKRVENRTWPVSYRGPLAIHAGVRRGYDVAGGKWLGQRLAVPERDELVYGAIVATCVLVDCVPIGDVPASYRGIFAAGPWCWLLDDVQLLERPIYCRGMQSLWTPPAIA